MIGIRRPLTTDEIASQELIIALIDRHALTRRALGPYGIYAGRFRTPKPMPFYAADK